jgi:hypothetical protein
MNLIPLEKSQEFLVIWDVVHTASVMIRQAGCVYGFREQGCGSVRIVGGGCTWAIFGVSDKFQSGCVWWVRRTPPFLEFIGHMDLRKVGFKLLYESLSMVLHRKDLQHVNVERLFFPCERRKESDLIMNSGSVVFVIDQDSSARFSR